MCLADKSDGPASAPGYLQICKFFCITYFRESLAPSLSDDPFYVGVNLDGQPKIIDSHGKRVGIMHCHQRGQLVSPGMWGVWRGSLFHNTCALVV